MTVTLFPGSGVIGPGSIIAFASDAVIGGGPPYTVTVMVQKPDLTFIVSGILTSWDGTGVAKCIVPVWQDFFSGFSFVNEYASGVAPNRGDTVNVRLRVQAHGGGITTLGPFGAWTWEPSAFLSNLVKVLSDQIFTHDQQLNDIIAAVTFTAY